MHPQKMESGVGVEYISKVKEEAGKETAKK